MKNTSTFRRRQTTRNVRDQLEMLDDFLVDYSDGRGPSSEGEVQFTELITSALSILDEELGKPNHYSVEIGRALSEG